MLSNDESYPDDEKFQRFWVCGGDDGLIIQNRKIPGGYNLHSFWALLGSNSVCSIFNFSASWDEVDQDFIRIMSEEKF